MSTIPINSIAMPPHYVRGRMVDGRTVGGINGKNVADLMDVVIKAHDHLFKGKTREWKELVGKKLTWPFHTPILVAKNPKPEKVEDEKENKKILKQFKPHELIDGGHRLTVWRRLKQKEIEAKVENIPDPTDRFLEQYRTNAAHGLRLDKDARDNAIRVAHEVYKVSLTALAKETGMDRSSIIRILAEKQRKKGERAKPKKGATFTPPPASEGDMSIQGFMDRLDIIVGAFPKLAPELQKFVTEGITPSSKPKIATYVSRIREIADLFELPLKG